MTLTPMDAYRSVVRCACGCFGSAEEGSRYATPACRMRASRKRRGVARKAAWRTVRLDDAQAAWVGKQAERLGMTQAEVVKRVFRMGAEALSASLPGA